MVDSTTLLFGAAAAVTLAASLAAVIAKRTFHSVMFLGVALVAIAGLYVILGSPLIGVIQILVYVGGILTLFVFAVMFVAGDESEEGSTTGASNGLVTRVLGLLGVAGFSVGLLMAVFRVLGNLGGNWGLVALYVTVAALLGLALWGWFRSSWHTRMALTFSLLVGMVLVSAVGAVPGWHVTIQSVADDASSVADDLAAFDERAQRIANDAETTPADLKAAVADAKRVFSGAARHLDSAAADATDLTAVDPQAASLAAAAFNLRETAAFLREPLNESADKANLLSLGTTAAVVAVQVGFVGGQLNALPDGSESANALEPMVDALFADQLLPFEVLGVLLTAVMFGALVIARPIQSKPGEETIHVHPNVPDAPPAAPSSDAAATPPATEATAPAEGSP